MSTRTRTGTTPEQGPIHIIIICVLAAPRSRPLSLAPKQRANRATIAIDGCGRGYTYCTVPVAVTSPHILLGDNLLVSMDGLLMGTALQFDFLAPARLVPLDKLRPRATSPEHAIYHKLAFMDRHISIRQTPVALRGYSSQFVSMRSLSRSSSRPAPFSRLAIKATVQMHAQFNNRVIALRVLDGRHG
jgi:hypothetical protein